MPKLLDSTETSAEDRYSTDMQPQPAVDEHQPLH